MMQDQHEGGGSHTPMNANRGSAVGSSSMF